MIAHSATRTSGERLGLAGFGQPNTATARLQYDSDLSPRGGLHRLDPRRGVHAAAVDAGSFHPAATGFAEPDSDRPPFAAGAERAERDRAAAALVGLSLAEAERAVIEATIRACNGSLPRAARILGVSPSTLYRKRERWTDSPDDASALRNR